MVTVAAIDGTREFHLPGRMLTIQSSVRERENCPVSRILEEFKKGAYSSLSLDEREKVGSHARGCPRCCDELGWPRPQA